MPRNKFQNVDFDGIEDFLDYLPEDERQMVDILREIILDSIPDVKEKLSYNVPFYSRYSNICFLWPASVPWGNHQQEGVRLGFTKGYLINDDMGYLDKGARKQVYTKDFSNAQEIETDMVRAYIFEAVLVDEKAKKKSN